MKDKELKHCPFCGGTIGWENHGTMDGGAEVTIHCNKCNLEMSSYDDYSGGHAFDKLKEKWNKRVAP